MDTPGPTDSPSPGADEEPPAFPEDPLEVVVETLTPGVVPNGGRIRVLGYVRNQSDETWTDLQVSMLTSFAPMTSSEELTAAIASDPRTDVGGSRILDPGLYDDIGDLAPGRRGRFRLSVPGDRLEISGEPGVYWLQVHVLGTSEGVRLDGADGRARTFLPLVPPGTEDTQLALGLQVRNHVVRAPDGSLKYADNWRSGLSDDGRLDRIVALGDTAGLWPLAWVVDPAVLEAATSIAQGNPALELSVTEPEPDEPTARDWLEQLTAATTNRTVLALPYADLDVSAAVRQGFAGLVDQAFAAGAQVLTTQSIDATPALVPLDGLLSPEAFAELAPGVVVGLTGQGVSGPGPGPTDSALAMRQRLLADAALHALSADHATPLVRFLPPAWNPGRDWRRAEFFRGLAQPWLAGAALDKVLRRPAPAGLAVSGDDLVYPDEAIDAELPLSTLTASGLLADSGAPLEELLTDGTTVDEELGRLALTTSSTWNRPHPGLATARAASTRRLVESWLDDVTVRSPDFVTMSSETGTFQVTVVNGLDHAVTVGLRASVSGGRLALSDIEPLSLPAQGRGAVQIQAQATGIGIHQVTLQPVSESGVPVGTPATLAIRSSRVGLILWVIMGVGASALFGAIALRIWRRVRRRGSAPLRGPA